MYHVDIGLYIINSDVYVFIMGQTAGIQTYQLTTNN